MKLIIIFAAVAAVCSATQVSTPHAYKYHIDPYFYSYPHHIPVIPFPYHYGHFHKYHHHHDLGHYRTGHEMYELTKPDVIDTDGGVEKDYSYDDGKVVEKDVDDTTEVESRFLDPDSELSHDSNHGLAPKPVMDTPEVIKARQQHLEAVDVETRLQYHQHHPHHHHHHHNHRPHHHHHKYRRDVGYTPEVAEARREHLEQHALEASRVHHYAPHGSYGGLHPMPYIFWPPY